MENMPPWLIPYTYTLLIGPLSYFVIAFALSWLVLRRTITLAGSERRIRTLARLGIIGPLAILLPHSLFAATAVVAPFGIQIPRWFSFLPMSFIAESFNRGVALTIAAALLFIALLASRREQQPQPGMRALSPKRPWHSYATPALLWGALGVTILILITTLWQAFTPNSTADIDYISNIARENQLRIPSSDKTGFPGVFGLAHNAPALVALLLVCALLIVVLAIDANRPVPRDSTPFEVRAARASTARLLSWITLGALLLGLGAAWFAAGAPYDFAFDLGVREEGTLGLFWGSSFQGLVNLMHMLAPAVQGVGAAILLRISINTARATRTSRKRHHQAGQDPVLATVQASEGETC